MDSGNLFPVRGHSRKQIAEISLKAMSLMEYDAMNLGWNDLAFDTEFLNKMRSRAAFPLITSNVVYKDSGLPFGEKYIIKTVGNIRVGILGVMPLEPILKPTNKAEKSRVPIMQTAHIGKRLGYVKLTLNDAGQIIKTEDQMIRLNGFIPSEGRVIKLTSDDIGKKIREGELRKMEKEAKALLQLSPEKYYEMLMKEQTKTGGEK